ncbi:MAG: polyprenyl synthetase family protein, partial [Actinobacteria bacterium]|nr:polyprenyl synthetase family protein [Actinomycetota bacterium]
FALFHDDIMDGSVTRRGAVATHEAMQVEHRARGWSGDARRFGDGSAQNERRPDKAARICRYKSAKYTIERPLHLGALLADETTALLDAYSRYGLPLGEAFQLRDDVLGVFGDSSITGKPVGDDLREAKPTPLMALALQKASGAQRSVLEMVGRQPLNETEIGRVQQAIVDSGALAEMESTITRLTNEAIAAIGATPIAADVQTRLVELALFVSDRRV